MPRMKIKLADYEAMGIRTIRAIEPKSGTISRFEQGALKPIASLVEQLPDTPCILDWIKIQELLDD
jgi:hypothetical protein